MLLLATAPILFSSNNLWALSPHSSIRPNEVFEPFRVSLQRALKNGFFNCMFETDEELEFVEAVSVGDPHNYFTIENIQIGASAARVTISYLVQDKDGYGSTERYTFNTPGDYRQERIDDRTFQDKNKLMHSLYRRIDDEITSRLHNGELGEKESLFQNSTKRIVLKGKRTKNEYKIIYKFGIISFTDFLGAEILQSLDVRTPKVYPIPNHNHVWIEYIEPDFPLTELFLEWRQWDLDEETLKPLFKEIGKIITLLYLLGHDDFHPGNFILSSNKGWTIDFETMGQAAIYEFHGTNTPIAFRSATGHFLEMPQAYSPHFVYEIYSGILKGAKRARQVLPSFRRELATRKLDHLDSRLAIRPTEEYKEKNISPIPHYRVRISEKQIADLIQRRFKRLYKLLQHLAMVPDLEVERTFFWREGHYISHRLMDVSL